MLLRFLLFWQSLPHSAGAYSPATTTTIAADITAAITIMAQGVTITDLKTLTNI